VRGFVAALTLLHRDRFRNSKLDAFEMLSSRDFLGIGCKGHARERLEKW